MLSLKTGKFTQSAFAFLLSLALLASLGAAPAAAASKGPEAIADVAEGLLDTVVNISTSQKVSINQTVQMPQLPPDSPFRDFFEDFFNRRFPNGEGGDGQPRRPLERRISSLGSGFVIDPSGVVVTNNHVVESADEINVIFHDGTKLKAKLLGRDAKTDLAVLKVEPSKPLPAAKFGDSDKVRVGEWVMAIGNPFGLESSVTAGIISATNRNIHSGPYDSFLQTDAAINRGNSGGPLFNMDGEVIGINTAIISPGSGGGSVGIGFAIPSTAAQTVISQIRQYGETRRGWLGVRITDVNDDIAESLGMKEAKGALVAGVTDNGPAAQAGIEPGDVITKFNGHDIAQMRDLSRMVADAPIGSAATVNILRKGKEDTKQVKIARLEEQKEEAANNQESEKPNSPAPPAKGKEVLGLSLSEISSDLRRQYRLPNDLKGVLITGVSNDSLAAERRIQSGDVIMEISQEAVTKPADVEKRLDALGKLGRKSALLLLSNAQGELRFVTLPLKDEQ